jgi:phosphomannomutase
MTTPPQALVDAVEQWIQYDPNEKTNGQIKALRDAQDWAELERLFLPRIAFGTAGLRSRMAPGYKHMNELIVTQATQGFCQHILSSFPTDAHKRGVVIGYDARHNSTLFATIAANVFLSKNIKVWLFPSYVCTPLVPFGVTQVNAVAGLMITASHNPKDDNGYKVYWNNGVQIISPTDADIAAQIGKNLIPWTVPIPLTFQKPSDESLVASDDDMAKIIDDYYTSIRSESCFCHGTNSAAQIKATYTAMHGVGAKYTARALETYGLPPYIPTPEQIQPDPEFPTVAFPNPEEGRGALALAMKAADESGSTIILANDPDADRLAVAVKNVKGNGEWIILTGNEIASVFADWTFYNWRKKNGPDADPSKLLMVASTVSSKQLKSMAKIEGCQFRDTLTGFKWIGNEAKKAVDEEGCTVLVAYEVEIGFIVGHTSFDKDGVRCAATMYELANYWWVNNEETLIDRLAKFAKRYGYFKMVNSYYFANSVQCQVIADKLRDYNGTGTYPTRCGEYEIVSTRDCTLGKDTQFEDGLSLLPIQPDAQMLTFTFKNGATCTLRNSGTEPKLKYYVEVLDYDSPDVAADLLVKMTKAIVDEFIQPSLYGLVPKKD